MNKIKIFTLISMLTFSIFLSSCSNNEYRSISIFELDGIANVFRPSKGDIQAYENMNLENGDNLKVDNSGYVRLKMDDDKFALLEPKTEINILSSGNSKSNKTKIDLVEGSIFTEIQNKLEKNSTYEINTPSSTMSVRGTVFYVKEYTDENNNIISDISVFEGSVAVKLIDNNGKLSNSETIINAGKTAKVIKDSKNSYFEYENKDIILSELPETIINQIYNISDSGRQLYINKDEIEKLMNKSENIDITNNSKKETTELIDKLEESSSSILRADNQNLEIKSYENSNYIESNNSLLDNKNSENKISSNAEKENNIKNHETNNPSFGTLALTTENKSNLSKEIIIKNKTIEENLSSTQKPKQKNEENISSKELKENKPDILDNSANSGGGGSENIIHITTNNDSSTETTTSKNENNDSSTETTTSKNENNDSSTETTTSKNENNDSSTETTTSKNDNNDSSTETTTSKNDNNDSSTETTTNKNENNDSSTETTTSKNENNDSSTETTTSKNDNDDSTEATTEEPPTDNDIKEEYYIVKFISDTGIIYKTEKVKKGNSANAPENPEKEGYIFKGWDTNFSIITENTTIKAKWAKGFKVNFYVNGKLWDTSFVEAGKNAVCTKGNPDIQNLVFTGWDKSLLNIKSNMDINAQFKAFIDISEGNILINNNELKIYKDSNIIKSINISECEIAGNSTKNHVKISDNSNVKITLNNLSIDLSKNASSNLSENCAFEIGKNSKIGLFIDGANSLKSGPMYAGLQVGMDSNLTILGLSSESSLNAEGGMYAAGIGGGILADGNNLYSLKTGNITIKDLTVTATGKEGGAGIGSAAMILSDNSYDNLEQYFNIIITGKSFINASGNSGEVLGGTGIGGGAIVCDAEVNEININGSIQINDTSNVFAYGGFSSSGIGLASQSFKADTSIKNNTHINIDKNAKIKSYSGKIVENSYNYSGAGIGGGYLKANSNLVDDSNFIINIACNNIDVIGNNGGAGIGLGAFEDLNTGSNLLNSEMKINLSGSGKIISGEEILESNTDTSYGGAGIGGGLNCSSGFISIENFSGNIISLGKEGGAGIGGGLNGWSNDIKILNFSGEIISEGRDGGSGIGGGLNGGFSEIEIEGSGKISSRSKGNESAGIGSGILNTIDAENISGSSIIIGGNCEIIAVGGDNGTGIGIVKENPNVYLDVKSDIKLIAASSNGLGINAISSNDDNNIFNLNINLSSFNNEIKDYSYISIYSENNINNLISSISLTKINLNDMTLDSNLGIAINFNNILISQNEGFYFAFRGRNNPIYIYKINYDENNKTIYKNFNYGNSTAENVILVK